MRGERTEQRARARVPDEVHRVHALALDEIEHVLHVDVETVVQHDLAELRRPGIARGQERSQALRGILEHGRHDVVGSPYRRTTRVPAAHRAEEDVLVAPEDALRHAGSASRVEHVVVVRGAGTEIARRRRGVEVGGERPVVDIDHEPDAGAARGALAHAGVVHDPDGVRVGEQVLELVVDVAVVHVDRNGTQLVAREHRLEMFDRVAHVERDMRPGPRAAAREQMREAGRSFVELRIGASRSAADRGLARRDGIRHPLEEIREIELQRCPSTRRYSPILT